MQDLKGRIKAVLGINYLSKVSVGLILIVSLIMFSSLAQWKVGVIRWDVISYYAYLPATFIYHDLKLDYTKSGKFGDKVWPIVTPEGHRVIKTSMGLSFLYLPFFLLAHANALLFGLEADGYSYIYSFWLLIGNIFYVTLGCVFLRKVLLKYFCDSTVFFTLIVTYFGTNLLLYTIEGAMSHSYNFFLVNVFLYLIIRWHEQPSFKSSFWIGIVFGTIIIVRPVNILFSLVFIFYGVTDFNSLKEKFLLIIRYYYLILLILAAVVLMFFPQMCYWKYVTGKWFYWSYVGETFFWTKPHIIEGLFGFRKGWFIYTPIMIVCTMGLFLLKNYAKKFSFIFPLFWMIFTYVILCWWAWWYGGGLSIRPYIDMYGILAFGFAASIELIKKFKKLYPQIIAFTLIAVLSVYSGFINYQYWNNVIHYDSMTFKAWKYTFLRTDTGAMYNYVESPNYKRAIETGEE
jgi:hypothetical protein